MERIAPIDLEGARLPKARKGYEVEAVDAILRVAAGEIESLLQSVQELTRSGAEDKRELESFRLRESTLAEVLLLAQRTADETRAAAHKQADAIVVSAKNDAMELRSKANEEIIALERKIEQLERDKANFESRFSMLLRQYLDGLSEHDFRDDRAA